MRAEQSFVTSVAIVQPSSAALAVARAALSQSGFSWEIACDLAARNWVLPAVAFNVLSHDDLRPPSGSDAEARLNLAATAARIRLEAVAQDLRPVWERWDAAGMPWALMKGASLMATLCPPHSRLLNDVDVLVAPEDYECAREGLVDAGFAPATGALSEEDWLRIKGQTPFSNRRPSESAATTVDLHIHMYAPTRRFTFDTHELLARRQAARFECLPVHVLDPADVLLHLATQLLNDRLLATLLRLSDLGVLLARVDPVECDRRAAASGSIAALAFARAAVARVFQEQAVQVARSGPVERRAASIAAVLVARGWPWADRVDSLPETYRQAAADVVQDGWEGALAAGLRRGFNYRRDRRRSGASAVRSVLGGVRVATQETTTLARMWWELHGRC